MSTIILFIIIMPLILVFTGANIIEKRQQSAWSVSIKNPFFIALFTSYAAVAAIGIKTGFSNDNFIVYGLILCAVVQIIFFVLKWFTSRGINCTEYIICHAIGVITIFISIYFVIRRYWLKKQETQKCQNKEKEASLWKKFIVLTK